VLRPGLALDPIAIFLDRDGTLNAKAKEGEYIRHPSQLTLLPKAAMAVAALNRARLPAVLISNQRWLSGRDADSAAYAAIHTRLEHLLQHEAGAHLDAAYCCPHAKESCRCRKPAPGLLLRASAELGLDLSRCVVIGDRASDIAAGRAVGAATVLLGSIGDSQVKPDAVVANLAAAVSLVLATKGDIAC
jgi:D-glycero-D-manno-heptose 1,7-bisphosphate phosphatase